jgi:hypothetical protein
MRLISSSTENTNAIVTASFANKTFPKFKGNNFVQWQTGVQNHAREKECEIALTEEHYNYMLLLPSETSLHFAATPPAFEKYVPPMIDIGPLQENGWFNEDPALVLLAQNARDVEKKERLRIEEKNEKLQQRFKDLYVLDKKCLGLLVGSIDEVYRIHVQKCDYAWQAMTAMKEYWNQNSFAQRRLLRQELESKRCVNVCDVMMFISQQEGIYLQLLDAGDTDLSENGLAAIIMSQLPAVFNNVVELLNVLSIKDNSAVGMDMLKKQIQQFDQKRKFAELQNEKDYHDSPQQDAMSLMSKKVEE